MSHCARVEGRCGHCGHCGRCDWPPERINFEIVESEAVTDRAHLRHIVDSYREMGCQLIAEGIETLDEARWLKRAGIARQQGYFFARPGLATLPEVPAARFADIDA